MVGCKKDPVTDVVYVLDSWNPGPQESCIANYHTQSVPEQSLYSQNSVCEWTDIVHLSNSFNNIRPAFIYCYLTIQVWPSHLCSIG